MNSQPVICFQSLSVIVLAVTETTSLLKTVDTIVQVCSKEDLREIIICPAYFATPECKKIAEELCEVYKDIPVTLLMQNGTFEDAMKDLFKAISGSHFIIQPADLEEDPEMIASFVVDSKSHPNAIITGSRFLLKKDTTNITIIKKIFFYLFRRLFQVFYSKDLTDTTFMYRIIPTQKIKALILIEKSYAVLYEAFLKLLRTGVEVIEIPVEFHKSTERRSKVKFFRDGFRYLGVFFRVRFADINSFNNS
jgi:hypothetical protein